MTSGLYTRERQPFPLYRVKIRNSNDQQLLTISRELGIGLNIIEMKAVRDYFKRKERDPTDVELQIIGQTWSEHCFHKTFKAKIEFEGKEIDGLFNTYIAKTTETINPSWCISVFEDNAGIVNFEGDHCVAVKVETHNHPSAVEPFGGAATGTGGVIRDILGVWADPIACTDVLGFGPLDFNYEDLPLGVKHPKYVYRGVVAGIGNYGNNMGIPTVNGAVYFDESYVGNVIVYCGCIGLLPLKMFRKNAVPNDLFVLAGGKTGRDGVHGVTFASAELTEESEEFSRTAVQIANPIEEEKLRRAIVEIRDLGLASSITDLGGGGLSSAVGETAKKFRCGAVIELERVPLKNADLTPWEIYISESQERMLLTVPANNLNRVLEVFRSEDVEATAIGKLTSEGFLRILYQGEEVAEMKISFLFDPPRTVKTAVYRQSNLSEPFFHVPKDLTNALFQVLSSPNIASKESIVRSYDHEVKGNTVLKPLQGEIGGPNDAAILKPLDGSWKGLTISCGMNPNFGKIDTYWMAASAIDEAMRNNVAVGGRRIALLDNFSWGNPEMPERLGSLVKACEACRDIAASFGTPFISGKDSLYNESPLGPVTPTLLITALGVIPDIRLAVSADVKSPDNLIFIVGKTIKELGGSEYYKTKGFIGRTVPKVLPKMARKAFETVTKAIDSRLVKSCHDLSEGGLAVASAEMALSGNYGLELDLRKVPCTSDLQRDDFVLFSESNSRFLIEVSPKAKERFETLVEGVAHAEVGKVTKSRRLHVVGQSSEDVLDASLDELLTSWKRTLNGEV